LLGLRSALELPLWCLPFVTASLVTAETLRVRFRRGAYVDAITLLEAVLAPLVFAFPTVDVVVTVGLAQVAVAVVRRSAPVKAAFNAAQWMFAAAIGSIVVGVLAGGAGLGLTGLGALVAALAVIAVANS